MQKINVKRLLTNFNYLEFKSIFLWGPRQVGKTSLLKSLYPDSIWLDLLLSEVFAKYATRPQTLREELANKKDPQLVVVDEIQKIPALLDEIHWLLENSEHSFILSGSSVRKLKRGHANLLGGRAIRYEMHGLSARELGTEFDLQKILNNGYLPKIYFSSQPKRLLQSYVADYLKEEVAAEGLVRNLPHFSSTLEIAALSDGEVINYSTIARDVGVSSKTIASYFEILQDTLIGRMLPAYTKRPKRKVIESPKFYFFDVGLVNYLAKRGNLEPKTELYGKAFENWVYHELLIHSHSREWFYDISYWRLTTGVEVDFILGPMKIAIEAKAKSKVTSDDLKGLKNLKIDFPEIETMIVVTLELTARKTSEGILIVPYQEFLNLLWNGDLNQQLKKWATV